MKPDSKQQHKLPLTSHRRMETAIWIHNFFFSWPYHTVYSPRPHLALLLFLDRGVFNRRLVRPKGPRTHSGVPSHSLALSATDQISSDRKLFWLKTDCISRRHLHISFHYTHTFPFNHVTASAYFHMCVPCRESLMTARSRVNMRHSVCDQFRFVGCSDCCWPSVVGFEFKFLVPFVLFLPLLTCRRLCLWKAARDLRKALVTAVTQSKLSDMGVGKPSIQPSSNFRGLSPML